MKLKNGVENERVNTHCNAYLVCSQSHTPFFNFKNK